MTERPTIVEVSRRSDQGVTEPFYCRADDGVWYWVKGLGAGKQSLCAEWLAGSIAQELGLPVPAFRQLFVPEQLVRDSLLEGIRDLGSGLVFGSADVNNCREFVIGDLRRVRQQLRAAVLFFDWMVHNTDRRLSPQGGNPNLLWSIADERVWVIDHNLAFDNRFVSPSFFTTHVFAGDRSWLVQEGFLDFRVKMSDIIMRLDTVVREIPEDWLYLDPEHTQPVDLVSRAKAILDGKNEALESEWGMEP